LLPPLAWAALGAVKDWRRNPDWLFIQIGLATCVLAVVALGGQGLILAWATAEVTGEWSSEPAVRTIVGVGLIAVGGYLSLGAETFDKPAPPGDANDSARTGGAAEPGAAPDRG
jgi:hypothetical protein